VGGQGRGHPRGEAAEAPVLGPNAPANRDRGLLPGRRAPEPGIVPPAAPVPDAWPFAAPPDPVAEAKAPRPAPAEKTAVPVTPVMPSPADVRVAAGTAAVTPAHAEDPVAPRAAGRVPRAWCPALGP
jgi:hypothetical protein